MPTVQENVAQAGLIAEVSGTQRNAAQIGLLVEAASTQRNVAGIGLMVDVFYVAPEVPRRSFVTIIG
jgi:hypothetical protein